MIFTLRGMLQREADAGVIKRSGDSPAATFEELLRVRDYPSPDPVLTWPDIDVAAALDVDMPRGQRITFDNLAAVMGSYDEPEYYWATHGGGFRGIFFARDPLTAEERAALFAFLFIRRERIDFSRIEIKRDTRHPGYRRTRDGGRCWGMRRGHNADAARAVAAILGEDESVTDAQADVWLQANGFERGRRYEHERCPIAPSSSGRGNPVYVTPHGVYCHYCAGSGPRGFIPFVELIDADKRHKQLNFIKPCACHMAHWVHARLVIEAMTGETGKRAELLYRAMLKTVHLKPALSEAQMTTTRALIDSTFYPSAEILRGRGQWFHPDLATPCGQAGLPAILATLPAVLYVDEEGKKKVSARRLGFLQQNGNIASYGYPSLIPIRGVNFGWQELLASTQQRVPVESWPTVRVCIPADPPFTLRPATELPWAESHIQRYFPGVRLDILRLLIAGKGVSQLDPSEPPLAMIHGQSESSKTAHLLLAAELSCDRAAKITIGKDMEEFLRHVAAGADVGALVFFDEIAKSKDVGKILPDRILRVTRGQNYRALYVGSIPLPPLPVIVMADTVVPEVMRTDVQLARRIVEIDLGCGISVTGKDWRATCGTGDILGWRAASEDNAKAADIFVSDVIRNFAASDFKAIAKRLGFTTFRDAVGDLDTTADHRAFFDAVCSAPDANSGYAKGRGYKLIDVDRLETSVEITFRLLGEQSIKGAKWGDILGLPGVECDYHPRHKKAYVRFRLGKPGDNAAKINGEIVAGEPVATVATPVATPVATFAESTQLDSSELFAAMRSPVRAGCDGFSA